MTAVVTYFLTSLAAFQLISASSLHFFSLALQNSLTRSNPLYHFHHKLSPSCTSSLFNGTQSSLVVEFITNEGQN